MTHLPSERNTERSLQQINIFISSPSDVNKDRQDALRVVHRLNQLGFLADRYHLKPLAYEEIVPAAAGQKPQTIVDHYMMQAGQSDIFICILWHRMGTPVIYEETGERFQSGTEYEFLDAYRANQKSGKPYILLYRCMKPLPPDADPEQLKRVQDFFNRLKGEHAEFKGLHKTYQNSKNFEEILFHDLESIISKNFIGSHNVEIGSNLNVERIAQEYRLDWEEAPHIGQFYGREQELAELERWIAGDHCHLVAVLGIGGIGKTVLAAKLVEQIKDDFEYVFWRSLQHAPPLESLLKECVPFLSNQQCIDLPKDVNGQISLLIGYLRKNRCLLILDNFETVLQEGSHIGRYREGYEGYAALLRHVGDGKHQSCLLLTSREKPKEVVHLEGKTSPVRSLPLLGLEPEEGQALLKEKGLSGSHDTWTALVRLYSGNPLYLKLVSEPIQELFGGDIVRFLRKGVVVFGDIRDPLDLQFTRLSQLEREIMYWLAIEREAVSLDDLREDIVHAMSEGELLVAVGSLRRRSMIESSGTEHFTLQPVIMEYVTNEFVKCIYREIDTEKIELFESHALLKAQAKDYVRSSQIRLILTPLTERLLSTLGKGDVEEKIKSILTTLRKMHTQKPSYAAGNALNLLVHLQSDLHGADFSHMRVQQAYLQGVTLPNVNFAHAHLATSVFTDTFGSVAAVACSPDGKLIAAGTAGGEICLWQVTSGTPLLTCQRHTDTVFSIAFSPDGSTLASSSGDQTIRLWEVSTGKCFRILQGRGWIRSVTFSPDGNLLASGSEDQTIRLWEVSTGKCLKTLQGHTDRVYSVTFSPDGNLLASSSEDQTIRLWEVSTGKCFKTLSGHIHRIWSVAFSPEGNLLASGSEDQMVRVWNLTADDCLLILRGHGKPVWSVAFDPSGDLLASSGYDQTVRIWDIRTGECIRTLQGHSNLIRSIAFSPNGEILISGSHDQTVRVWDLNSGQCLTTLQGHANRVWSVAFSPDGSLLASGSEDHKVRVWEVNTGQCLRTLRHTNWVASVAFSPDGNRLASGSEDLTVRVWEVSTGQILTTLREHTGRVWSVAFSPDGNLLASGSYDQTARIWDLSTSQCLFRLEHIGRVRSVTFSPGGNLLASGSLDTMVRVWAVNSGQCLKTLQGHTMGVYSVTFNSDGSLLASSGEDQEVRIWEVNTGGCLKILPGHTGLIRSLSFSPDGNLLASGSHDQTIRIWNLSTGQCLKTLRGHNSWIWSVAFSPDGSMLASGSHDGTVKLWDLQTEKCLRTLRSERPYEGMNITHVTGLTEAQKATLKALGAIEEQEH